MLTAAQRDFQQLYLTMISIGGGLLALTLILITISVGILPKNIPLLGFFAQEGWIALIACASSVFSLYGGYLSYMHSGETPTTLLWNYWVPLGLGIASILVAVPVGLVYFVFPI
ncbi:MAG: hypothetical protein H0W44_07295 [Gammaproteobacteria bacterium]|nr:hypothetical protein [Gammaproteobacteria bacterium]